MATWLATFALYLVVKPSQPTTASPVSLLNAVPTWVDESTSR
ncbi:hypothetical protein [Nocardia camponoti]|nr:hypothetical protein [Nocardia camponoti]